MSESDSLLAREVASGHPVLAKTQGDSMWPLLYTNRTAVLIETPQGPLHKNDLPLYRRPSGQFVMHRVIRVEGAFYYTRGDNRIGLEQVPADWVLGVVTEIHRGNKTFPVTNRWYRLYVAVWNGIYPLRWVGRKCLGLWRRLRRRFKRQKTL